MRKKKTREARRKINFILFISSAVFLLFSLSLSSCLCMCQRETFLPHTLSVCVATSVCSFFYSLSNTFLLHYFNVYSLSLPFFLLIFFLLPSAMNLEVEHTTGRHFLFFCTSGTFIRQTSLIFQYCQFYLSLSLSLSVSFTHFSFGQSSRWGMDTSPVSDCKG